MIIHQCLSCGKLSPNRIAGDDNEYRIINLLKESINLEANIVTRLKNLNLSIITKENQEEVLISLFGINYQKYTENFDGLI